MYAYLKGILMVATPSYAIVEVQGVGYHLSIPCRLLSEFPHIGQVVHFYTSFVVREMSHTLYGFLSTQERDLFEMLMNVTGIGPKLALSLIGHLALEELHLAIANQDLPTLCKVPGVGKKTAERLIVELKDKLPHLLPLQVANWAMTIPSGKQNLTQDAMQALIHLGYTQATAQKALKQCLQEIPETADLALMITTALRHI